jgi:hypothetical protein
LVSVRVEAKKPKGDTPTATGIFTPTTTGIFTPNASGDSAVFNVVEHMPKFPSEKEE